MSHQTDELNLHLILATELIHLAFLTVGPAAPKGPEPGGIGYSNIINCDDEEDCIAGSGSGDGPPNNVLTPTGSEANGADGRVEVWYPEGTDSKLTFSLFVSRFLFSCTIIKRTIQVS